MANWDAVYTEKLIENATPADVLKMNAHLLPKGNSDKALRALDFASGLAGNGLYLAQHGFDVYAWDMSKIAVEKINQYAQRQSLSIKAQCHDLEKAIPSTINQFDIIVVSYFLHRETLRYLYDALLPGGLLFYQTFSGEQVQSQGPSRAAYRLQQGELLKVFSDMQLLFYREDPSTGLDAADTQPENVKSGQVYFIAKK